MPDWCPWPSTVSAPRMPSRPIGVLTSMWSLPPPALIDHRRRGGGAVDVDRVVAGARVEGQALDHAEADVRRARAADAVVVDRVGLRRGRPLVVDDELVPGGVRAAVDDQVAQQVVERVGGTADRDEVVSDAAGDPSGGGRAPDLDEVRPAARVEVEGLDRVVADREEDRPEEAELEPPAHGRPRDRVELAQEQRGVRVVLVVQGHHVGPAAGIDAQAVGVLQVLRHGRDMDRVPAAVGVDGHEGGRPFHRDLVVVVGGVEGQAAQRRVDDGGPAVPRHVGAGEEVLLAGRGGLVVEDQLVVRPVPAVHGERAEHGVERDVEELVEGADGEGVVPAPAVQGGGGGGEGAEHGKGVVGTPGLDAQGFHVVVGDQGGARPLHRVFVHRVRVAGGLAGVSQQQGVVRAPAGVDRQGAQDRVQGVEVEAEVPPHPDEVVAGPGADRRVRDGAA